MNFINPIEILNLGHVDAALIDNSLIKKEKRKLFAEIALNDDEVLDYHTLKISKSDCERVIEELDENDKKDFYYFIANSDFLNNYLITGDENIFNSFQRESIFQLTDFQNFLAPYFLPRFDKSILSAFKSNDYFKAVAILRGLILITDSDLNSAFKSLGHEIDSRIRSIEEITLKIKQKNSDITRSSIGSLLSIVKSLFPVKILNVLPKRIFQSVNNKIASATNFLQLAIDNEFNDVKLSLSLIEYVLEFELSSVSIPTFQKNREILKERNQRLIDKEINAPFLKKYNENIAELSKMKISLEKRYISSSTAMSQINLLVDVTGLNALPVFGDEVRDDTALILRAISVAIWNSYEDVDTALLITKKATILRISPSAKKIIDESTKKLEELKEDKRANEIIEIQSLIKVVTDINNQILRYGMVNMKIIKIKELLNDLFPNKVIEMLAVSKEQYLKRNLFTELEKVLVKLDAFYTNDFLKKLKPLGNNDGELALKIQNGISGVGFVTKNVANNVGTGLGKANKAMVNNLPSRLVGIIYLLIIMMIIGGICSLFGC